MIVRIIYVVAIINLCSCQFIKVKRLRDGDEFNSSSTKCTSYGGVFNADVCKCKNVNKHGTLLTNQNGRIRCAYNEAGETGCNIRFLEGQVINFIDTIARSPIGSLSRDALQPLSRVHCSKVGLIDVERWEGNWRKFSDHKMKIIYNDPYQLDWSASPVPTWSQDFHGYLFKINMQCDVINGSKLLDCVMVKFFGSQTYDIGNISKTTTTTTTAKTTRISTTTRPTSRTTKSSNTLPSSTKATTTLPPSFTSQTLPSTEMTKTRQTMLAPTTSSNESNNAALFIGIACGASLLTAIIVLLYCTCCKKRCNKKAEIDTENNSNNNIVFLDNEHELMEHKVLEHKASAPNEYMCPQSESTTNVYLTPNIELEKSYAEPNFAVGRSKFYGQEPVSPYYVTNILPKNRSRFQKFADSFKSSLQKNSSLTHNTLSQKHSYIDLDAPNSSTYTQSTKESEVTPDHKIVDKSTVSDRISETKDTISRELDKPEASLDQELTDNFFLDIEDTGDGDSDWSEHDITEAKKNSGQEEEKEEKRNKNETIEEGLSKEDKKSNQVEEKGEEVQDKQQKPMPMPRPLYRPVTKSVPKPSPRRKSTQETQKVTNQDDDSQPSSAIQEETNTNFLNTSEEQYQTLGTRSLQRYQSLNKFVK
ncbi:uncharacterized protein LOC130625891 isoform X2 [Hydractinia symbiolongicarpus]|uniref:uncharacterized protein LOC130625891 isoform X2 n=1 Tax=Hydractinia symbiolongicarpus TaxID=13093 RepID=UPI002550B5CE|nr:uncharacterized protein LOC130625891 isoform X2 [Hydractinia symbiolongicarpus]